MKRMLSLLLALLLCAGSACSEESGRAGTAHTIAGRRVTIYYGSTERTLTMPFYFLDGAEDLPYVDMPDWCEALNYIYREFEQDAGYRLTCQTDGETVYLTRENGFFLQLSFDENIILFNDYNAFLHNSSDSALLDLLSMRTENESGEPELFQRVYGSSFDRYGDILRLELNRYSMDLIHQDGCYLVPLQTLCDFTLAPQVLYDVFYNGQCAIIANSNLLGNVRDGLTELGEMYYAAEPTVRSPQLAEFGYRELCLVLDSLYGLKESHAIQDFSRLFWQIGFDEALVSENPEDADTALYNFLDFYLDDIHTSFNGYSWMTGKKTTDGMTGRATRKNDVDEAYYRGVRASWLGEEFEAPSYEEVGNTAYLTLDNFSVKGSSPDYYLALEGALLPKDTIGMVIYAHSRIYREDSPIENVVIDLSCNIGGAVDAAVFLVAWFLGEAPLSIEDTLTGARSTAAYRADVNLDRMFDDRDTVSEKNLYCLISPVSFSCGNLVPAILRESGRVTLLGKPTNGGSCTVLPLSTAWGSIFKISGNRRMSFQKNGSFYDMDRGVEPDLPITRVSTYYNRERLTDILNQLY